MKLKSDGKGGWQLLDAPEGAQLRRIAINFVTSTTTEEQPQGGVGSSTITVKVETPDGKTQKFQDVTVEWP